MTPKIEKLAPDLKYIEIVAFLQEQWEKLDTKGQNQYKI